LGIVFGFYLDHAKMPLLGRLKAKMVAIADKRIVKEKREAIHRQLMDIHRLTMKRYSWGPLIIFFLAPYAICYVLLIDKKIMDCIFSFTLLRFLRKSQAGRRKKSLIKNYVDSL
jgi:hypothetical protein